MQKWLLVLIVISACMCAVAWAQESGQVVVSLTKEYIREWLVLGPFFPDDLDKDFLADAGGEASINPKEGDTVTTADGKTLAWKLYKSEESIADLLDAVGNYENATAYAFCILQNEVAGDARVYVGSDDGIAVWINGKQVHHHSVGRALRLDRDMLKASLKAGTNRCLVKVSQGTEAWAFAMRADLTPPSYAVLSGIITDAARRPVPNAAVRLEQRGEEIARATTDDSGRYRLSIYPARGLYELSAMEGERGNWQSDIRLREGRLRTLNLTLRKTVSIEGTLLMLDNETPHVAVPVQAIVAQASLPVGTRNRVAATALSDGNGEYRLMNLKPGYYHVRCQVMGGYICYGEDRNITSEPSRATPLQVKRGRTLRGIDFHLTPFRKGTWKNYDTIDGLAHNAVSNIYRDQDGAMWFATQGGGVSRYDGKTFVNLTTKDGLANNTVLDIYVDPDGVMWFGTSGGVSRYDGKEFVNFTKKDGLDNSSIKAVHGDPDGVVWFGTGIRLGWGGSGVFRYDGKKLAKFTEKDGLAGDSINAIHCDLDGMMWFGTSGGVSRYDGREFVNFTKKDGLASDSVNAIYCDLDGVMWFGTSDGVSRYDGKEFANLITHDGLVHNTVLSIHRDLDGVMWFGTVNGVSRYDGKTFVNFTTRDGLANDWVNSIHGDPDGVMWFGTGATDTSERGGVSRYCGKEFVNFTEKDGLIRNAVIDICRSPDGAIWFATEGGVSRYDQGKFVSFTTEDGLVNNYVLTVCSEPDGVIWFGTIAGVSRYDGRDFASFTTSNGLVNDSVFDIYHDPDGVVWFGTGGGVSRYDGKEFVNLTAKDGLVHNLVAAIYRSPDGGIWFGTWGALGGAWGGGGASHYDGKEFLNFTTSDGLPDNSVSAIYGDLDGTIWFGTLGGLSRYDGKKFAAFSIEDGLVNNRVSAIYGSTDGRMWAGTDGGGISCYDGIAWTSLDTRDGLAGNSVSSIHRDPEGSLWLGTDRGITRYRRSAKLPKIHIASVTTDQTYRDLSAIPAFPIGTRVTIEYSAIDFKTVPEKRQYRCRIQAFQASRKGLSETGKTVVSAPVGKSLGKREMDSDWREPTKSTEFDWVPQKPGTYTFEVQAIDRDLNYSEPASLSIAISAPPFYRTGAFLIALSIIGGGSLLVAIIFGVQRSRASNAERLRLQHELEDARQMQVGLLPESAPSVEGFDIAGFSKPAREVGGDFFDYLPLTDAKIGIALADISDKGLKAAMNAVLADGMLREVAKDGASCSEILSTLNADLYPLIEKQMFAALGLAILDYDAITLQWANAAQPYPMVKRDERVFEIKGSSELPLGMRQEVAYSDLELDLQSGDIVIFYTDGIIEAENEAGEMYGTERLEQVVTQANSRMNAKRIIEAILQDVTRFAGTVEQYDDMTVVVVRKVVDF